MQAGVAIDPLLERIHQQAHHWHRQMVRLAADDDDYGLNGTYESVLRDVAQVEDELDMLWLRFRSRLAMTERDRFKSVEVSSQRESVFDTLLHIEPSC